MDTKKSIVVNRAGCVLLDDGRQYSPTLAVILGLDEALFIQQQHFLLRSLGKARKSQPKVGWYYNFYRRWHEMQFPFWSERKLRRVINALEERGMVRNAKLNRSPGDQTKWYTINYDLLDETVAEWLAHNNPPASKQFLDLVETEGEAS